MKKKLQLLVFSVLFSVQAFTQTAPTGWTNGSGGQISNLEELRWLSETADAWDEDWLLTQHIDATNTNTWNVADHDHDNGTTDEAMGFSPIGNASVAFTGSLDGGGKTVSNLYINRPQMDSIGFFGVIEEADIKYLFLEDVAITGRNKVASLAAILKNTSTVFSSTSSGSVVGNNGVGAFVGDVTSSIISNCYTECHPWAVQDVGGFVLHIKTGSIIANCFTIGNITAGVSGLGIVDSGTNAGGIASSNQGSVENCYFLERVNVTQAIGDDATDECAKGMDMGEFNTTNYPDNFIKYNTNHIWKSSGTNLHLRSELYDHQLSVTSSIVGAMDSIETTFYDKDESISVKPSIKNGYVISAIIDENQDTLAVTGSYSSKMLDQALNLTILFDEVQFESGDGTPNDPYTIANLKQLALLSKRDHILSGQFELVNDIDATETKYWNIYDHDNDPTTAEEAHGFSPIGSKGSPFVGSFNGNGYTINGLYINYPAMDNVGLISYVNTSQDIKNVNLKNISIIGGDNVAGLAGYVKQNSSKLTLVENIRVQGTITGSGYVGGIIGEGVYVHLMSSSSNCFLFGNDKTGGLAGKLYYGKLTNSYAYFNYSNGGTWTGGLVGVFSSSNVENCYTQGVLNYGYAKGGLFSESSGSIKNCYTTVRMISAKHGALVGHNHSTIINTFHDSLLNPYNVSIQIDYSEQTIDSKTFSACKTFDFASIWDMQSEKVSENEDKNGDGVVNDDDYPWVANPNGRPYLYFQDMSLGNSGLSFNNDSVSVEGSLVNISHSTNFIEYGYMRQIPGEAIWQKIDSTQSVAIKPGENVSISLTNFPLNAGDGLYLYTTYAKDENGAVFYGDIAGYTHKYSIAFKTDSLGRVSGNTLQYSTDVLTSVEAIAASYRIKFVQWETLTGDSVTSVNPITVEDISNDTTLFARFVWKTFQLNLSTDGNGTIQGDTVRHVIVSESDSIFAIANKGYEFKEWVGSDGHARSKVNPLVIPSVTIDCTLVAIFNPLKYAIDIQSAGPGEFLVNNEPEPYFGELIEIYTEVGNNAALDSIRINDVNVTDALEKSGSKYTLYHLVEEDMVIMGYFSGKTYALDLQSEGPGKLVVNSENPKHGDEIEISTTLSDDVALDSVILNGSNITNAFKNEGNVYSYSKVVTKELTIRGYFSEKSGVGIMDYAMVTAIYPNPAKGMLHIKTKESAVVSLYNITGQLILEKQSIEANQTENINLTSIKKGIYFVHFDFGSKIEVQKIMVE